MAPFVDLGIYFEWLAAAWMLRDDDLGGSFIHVFDDPVGIEGLVRDQAAEFGALDQGGHAYRVMALAWQENEAHQVAQGIRQSQDLGRQAAS